MGVDKLHNVKRVFIDAVLYDQNVQVFCVDLVFTALAEASCCRNFCASCMLALDIQCHLETQRGK